MPHLVDYPKVLDTLAALGLRCVYPNSGAFDFRDTAPTIFGFGRAADPTIKPALRESLRITDAPFSEILQDMSSYFSPTSSWLMPASHWAYEARFGHAELLGQLLPTLGLDAGTFRDRVDAAAIAFGDGEPDLLARTVDAIARGIRTSDFIVAFPDSPTLATVHQHGQLWIRTTDPRLREWEPALRR